MKRSFNAVDVGPLEHAALQYGARIEGMSNDIWRGKSPEEFAVAYAFWVFKKGYRYLATLPEGAVYVPHFVREKISVKGLNILSTEKDSEFASLFPWRPIVRDLLLHSPASYEPEVLVNILRKLRIFTRRDEAFAELSQSLQERGAFDATKQFIKEGLAFAMPLDWGRNIDSRQLVSNAAAQGLTALSGQWKLLELFIKGIRCERIKYQFPEISEHVALLPQTVRRVLYRNTVNALMRDHREALQKFFDARGWDYNLSNC